MKYPFVSVVIPVKNEEDYIEECLESLINQDYPKNKYEIIIADGMSDDKTKEIIKNVKKKNKFPKIRVFDNEKITTASGFNLGVKKSKGEYVVRMMGHAIASENFIRETVLELIKEDSKTIMVSTNNDIANKKGFGFYTGLVMKSFLGGLGSCYRKNKKDVYKYSGGFGAIRKKDFIEIGGLNEDLTCGDDAEFNQRIKNLGFRVLIKNNVTVFIYKRSSLNKFIKQMFEFGQARSNIIKLNKKITKNVVINFMPTIFLCYLIFVFLIKNFILMIPIILYFFVNLISAISVSKNLKEILYVFILTLFLHLSYGFGFLIGLFK